MKNSVTLFICLFLLAACDRDTPTKVETAVTAAEQEVTKTARQNEILNEHLRNGARKFSYYSREWQEEIDKGLAKDSTIAYLWQQKAMPMFKQGKYEVGMECLDKAVRYDRGAWLDYRAFIKCIFAKTYREAIADFEECQRLFGNGHVMDHSYNFHIALSYLQLNEFETAESLFRKEYEHILATKGESWLHPLDMFYYGLSLYEQKKYEEAIDKFDVSLSLHDVFSDAQYYKSQCLSRIGRELEANELLAIARTNGREGNSITEDNVQYERYPYQVRW